MTEQHEVAVVGLGIMGAATLAALARRGVSAVGIEQFDVPHAFGSSHGGTRVIRKAYYEDARYVPLLHRAWDAWRALEAEVGETLLIQTGGLHFGPRDDAELAAVMQAVGVHGLAHELLDAPGITRRYPQFRPDAHDVGLIEHDAGLLFAERSLQALIEVAQRGGAVVHAREPLTALTLGEGGGPVVIQTPRRRIACRRAVLTLGPWWPEFAPLSAPIALTVERQVQLWVRPDDPAAFRPGRFPVFLRYGRDVSDLTYGMPEAFYPGLKIALHHGGVTTSPATVDRALAPEDEARVRRFLAAHLPGANGPLLAARVCMYTNSADHHFALGLHPDAPEVVVGTGFSGHGFKLAPVVGEILADFALDGASASTIDLFSITRPRG